MGKSHRRHGFTLVELLVVIGVIALLISILLPTLAAARNQARTIKCGSNQRQIYFALNLYAQDNHGWIPPRGLGYTPYPYWQNFLTSYNAPNNWFPPISYLNTGKVFFCPSQDSINENGTGTLRGGYGLNNRMFNFPGSVPPRWIGMDAAGTYYYNLGKARQPCDIYLISDTGAIASASPPGFLGQPTLLNQTSQRPDFRHARGINMLYQDGHVGYLKGQVSPFYTSEVADSGIYTYAPPWWNNATN